VTYEVFATNAAGSTVASLIITVIDAAPAGLNYATPAPIFTIGQAATPDAPFSTGGTPTSYAIAPALPDGLTIDAMAGVISGTPTMLSPGASYTVTASNTGGSTTAVVTITVVDLPPIELTYSESPATFTRGFPITNDTPSSEGGAVVLYAVSPALPPGLTLDPSSGVLSGTPTTVSATTSYIVTATNSGGSTRGTLTLTIIDIAPSALTYSTNPAVYTIGDPITPNMPSHAGGLPNSYAIAPPLPSGLSMDPTTGSITGVPTALAAATPYTITAANWGGSASVTLSIAVNDIAPSALTYATLAPVYTLGQQSSNDVPTSSGGAVVAYTVAPPLPDGLVLDGTTGILSGTPVTLAPTMNYVVTATNSGGSTTATLSITVNDVAPSLLTYATNPAVFTKGLPIIGDVPTSSGGAIVAWSVSPPLPQGLVLNPVTGVLSGTPNALLPATEFTITAANSGGTTSATLNITVNDAAPSTLTYTPNPAVDTINTAVMSTPSNSGGAVISYTVEPALPAGLTLNPVQGVISGTATALSPATNYLVTAMNSGGSTSTTISIAIVDVPPSALTYPTNPATYTVGTAVAPDVPGAGGGATASWAIQPSLPPGLSFSSTTGTVSGTPSSPSAQATYTVTATNSGGSSSTTLTITVNNVPPTSLTYATNPAVFTKGVPIDDDVPTSSGGAVVSWSISPALPQGLLLSPTTGVLSGTPTTLLPATVFTVTAVNSGGTTTASLTLTVNDVAPSSLTYATNPAVYTLNTAVTNAPVSSGGAVVAWSVSPPLPQGLVLNPTTGVLSGTPTALLPATVFTVTAANSGGTTTASLTITVNDVAPSALTYATNPAVYTINTPVTNAPSNIGGAVLSYAIAPALPAGLRLDAAHGVISGTPTVLSPATEYLVTATNSGGSTSATLSVAVVDVAPSAITYPTNPATYSVGTAITPDVPDSVGGTVTSWAIQPSLPAGLGFSTTTGTVSGTPASPSTQVTYTVTATNSGGSSTTTLTITVVEAPSSLTYAMNPAVFTKGQTADDVPSSGGGAVLSYAMAPAPPAGLAFSTTTGILSGTPLALSPTATYLVTATNAGGSTTATLTITVNDVAPVTLTYASNPLSGTVGVAVSSDSPSSGGGPVVSYSVAPPLPAGLALDSVTGVVSGTPTAASSASLYTVTASNSGGSATTALTIVIAAVPPSSLTYSANPAVFTRGQAIASDVPSVEGGAATSFTISPALPAGLVLAPTTGVISGTPTVMSGPTTYVVTATNSGGAITCSLAITVNDAPPASLSYSANPAIFTIGQAVTDDTPSSSGGAVTSYDIAPALPAGLLFDTQTGVISGTPTVLSSATPYAVTATNSGGSDTVTLTVAVFAVAPSTLTYSANPATYTLGETIADNRPSESGGAVTSYSVTPTLPAGLSLNEDSGVISGTPTAVSSATGYLVTATNSGGSATAVVMITVVDSPPLALTYSENPATFTKGQPITDDTPSSVGGAVTSYGVEPALPEGLVINPATGVISGTPTEVTTATNYTVVATNSGGTTTDTLVITVLDVAPAALTYAVNPAVFTKGVAISADAPSSSGGAVLSYSITPALPAGLNLNTVTGVVSGTPSVLSPTTVYQVTATNSGGTTTGSLTITVNDLPPFNLTYSANPATYTLGSLIIDNVPSSHGGSVVSYAIAPSLPAGLSFDTATGIVSGTPSALSAPTTLTVTATNSGGSTTVALTLSVEAVAPSGLSYAVNPVTFTRGSAATDAPSSGGGAVVSYGIAPALAAGLSLNTTTGVISGTPTVLSGPVAYTVTATNSGGTTSATLTVSVIDAAPAGLTYSSNPATFTKGVAITNDTPSSSGGTVVSYSVTPALPSGLSINGATGIISGTPTTLSAATTYTVTATNSGGTTSVGLVITVDDQPPAALTYGTNPAVFTLGETITDDVPTSTGGAVVAYSVEPALPSGLSLNEATGTISGTPTTLSAEADYVVTGTNTGGSVTVTLVIAVNDVPPSDLTYSTNPATYIIFRPIANDVPASSGGAVLSYSITPALPAGLDFDVSTGVISGVPVVLASADTYTVSATNSGGTAKGTLTLAVNDSPPSGLTYGTTVITGTIGQATAPDAPSSTGGVVLAYAISTPLPTGLSFDTTTGIISGTPTELSPSTTYTVTATNSGGAATTTVTVVVDNIPPSALTYASNPAVFTINEAITNDVPSSAGGAVVSYAVTPALPAGLSFNPSTGVISGTPYILSAASTHTVTATNSGGSTTVVLTVTVNNVPPANLTYSTNPAIYTVGTAIVSNSPASTGGAVLSYAITPTLPAGLGFNTATGVISGTPTAISATAVYTVTATNSGGAATGTVSLTVNDIAPAGLTYSTNPAVYTIDQPITPDSPSTSGGAVIAYAISPALPAGLNFDTPTGVISGTPGAVSPEMAYVVVATNSGGSTRGTLALSVIDVQPSALTYATNPAVYTKGQAITADTPTSSGGAVVSYAVSPALPAGLSLNTTTGIISGNPTTVSPAATYTILATNSGGTASTTVTITVNDVAPSALTYSTNPATYTRGQVISANAPSVSGGAVVSFTMSPAPPAGLTFNTTTGVLTGIPSAVLPVTTYTVTAANTGGTTSTLLTITVVDVALSSLTYATNPAVYTKGVPIAPNAPTTAGGAVVSYAISPALPTGLSFSTSTGVVSGTPTEVSPQTVYTVTATNSAGEISRALSITVIDLPPVGLTYSTDPATYTVGDPILNDVPEVSGGTVVSYSIEPPLPAGLNFSTVTGVVSGTPAALATETNYTVTATNSGGAASTALVIEVVDLPPSSLTYSSNPAVYTKGVAIAVNSPSSTGGTVVSYGVSPALPSGLTFDTATGNISGTPTGLATAAIYTVTATDSGGTTSVGVEITVVDQPPSALTYSTNPAVYTKGLAIGSNLPVYAGGAVISYAVSPTLPAGLSLSATSGAITGTPTAVVATATYTVTATNTGGSTTATVSITVNDAPPAALSYATNPAVFTKGLAITNDAPSNTGGAVVSYAVSPALPAGLSLSAASGVISGTPTVLSAAATYTVTATNSGGSTTANLTITINDVAPSSLTYSNNPAIFTEGTAVTPDSPSSSGGAVLSYAISPALPAGLSFNTATGTISGSPTVLSAQTSYSVTATNTGGSTTGSVVITVVDVPPSGLTYTTNPALYTIGQAIVSNTPSTSGGGPVVSYAVSPGLPTGLSLSTSTGIISGTPTVLSAATVYTVTATNTGGATTAKLTITIANAPPANLTYSANPAVFTKGFVIANDTPTSSGGAVVSYAISPALPAGLAFNTALGIISGTPSAITPMSTYTVTATNTGGSTTATLTLTVNDVAPANLTYPTNPVVCTINQAMTNDVPASSGGGAVVSYSISPSLPQGLSLSTTSGVISGTPTVVSAASPYVVTASNTGGSTTVTLTLSVKDVAPSNLTYSVSPATFTVGTAITNDVPSNSGGTVISYSVNPALPAGLVLNTSTGVISGTPTAISSATNYTITATNSGGSTTATVSITVNNIAPGNLTYATNPAVYTKGVAIANNTPASTGGAVVSYSVSPTLPAGLSLSTTTGIISGTPTAPAAAANYTVTATNTGGSTTVTLSITVNPAAPAGITYATNPATYVVGTAIANNTPSSTGGAIASWSVSPSLPTGLSLSPTTGVVSGTPTTVTAAAGYVVTGTNVTGSSTVTLTLTVANTPPSNLTYPVTTATFTVGTTIANDVPTVSGGAVVSYSVSPALPAGLSLNTSTGVISGTPTAPTAQASYTVTATNSGGSTTAVLVFNVIDVAPSNLTYATNPATYPVNQTIANNVPSSSGGAVVYYAISPALPAGLALNSTTGVISGTPTAVTAAATYTVTASNTGGSTTVGLSITVPQIAPAGITYPVNPAVYTKGTAITPDAPSSTGGTIASWSISPALPAGLTLSTSTGVLSGTPTVISSATTYTVTATNSAGSATTSLTITVNAVAPSNLQYSTNPAAYVVNTVITNNTPSYSGGTIVSWSIIPSLPAGLSLNTGTGVISGTPTALSSSTSYTITGTNSGGSTTVTLNIEVGTTAAPAGLTYTSPVVYAQNEAASPNDPSSSGGVITSYTISPSLPSGLSMNASTGAISGTPAAISAMTTYTVTGSNSNGSTTASVTITVSGPGVLTYSSNPAIYPLKVAITQDTPSNTGSAIVSYAISPALPSGLAMSTSTGIISGTPTITAPTTTYTVTATNSGGLTTASLSLTIVAASGVTALGTGHGEQNCAIVNGGAECWGLNNYGQLGNGSTTNSDFPVPVSGLTSGVQQIQGGYTHTCALVNGGVQCWGDNSNYQIGNGSTVNTPRTTPVAVSGLTTGVQAIAVGWWHTCALVNGAVWCWGQNTDGQLGNDSTTNSALPVQVTGLSGVTATAAGGQHTCAIVANGAAECWGNNNNGQLGINSTTNSLVPVGVLNMSTDVTAIIAGFQHTCALSGQGAVWCCGYNAYGQLGNGTLTDSHTVVGVSGLGTGVQALAAGDYHTCAAVNGTVECWGLNSYGELGNSGGESDVPVSVSGVTGATEIGAGSYDTCALNNGAIECWGYNVDGELGNNSLTNSYAPVQVSTLEASVQTLVGGGGHYCALLNSYPECWGQNQSGQLGNGASLNSASPVKFTLGTLAGWQGLALGQQHTCGIYEGAVC
jgi:uncharacterized repeat protein (TIGR01451 family)